VNKLLLQTDEDTPPMKIGAIAPWFGGKRTLAPAIAEELGKHTQYFEPFCGSMAVLFAKPPAKQETVNDLHGDLINLARVLADPNKAVALYERLQRTLVCESLLKDAAEALGGGSYHPELVGISVDRAYWYFLASWMARNGLAGMDRIEFQVAVRWTAGGGSPAIRWRSATESIPAWHRRLTNVVILGRDAFDIIPRFEDAEHTAIYCDPPYAGQSRSDGNYLHDFSHESPMFGDDHKRLADVLRTFQRARIVVSYYDCPHVRKLYAGWTFTDHARGKNLHSQNGRGSRKAEAPEVLIINGPSFRE
jgi:DNA adenine methylase